MTKRKLLLIGWDAADWKAINPLMDAGLMPNLEKLVNRGVMGNLATLDPPLSPMLWTSISTGKRPYKHGIHGFSEPSPDNNSIRPVYITSRKVKALWNIFTQKGIQSHQIGWWPSHPAEPINGISISNLYQKANKPITVPWGMLPGTVHPEEKADLFKEMRIHHHELTQAHILPFIPRAAELDQSDKKAQKRLDSIRKVTAHAATIQAATTYILEHEEWDFVGTYFDAIDHYAHGFMKFNPPRQAHIPEEAYEMYKDVIQAGYRYHDLMLGHLVDLAGKDATIMLISDHGFYPGSNRPKALPKEPAGPAAEHSPYGIVVVAGPGIKKDETVFGASLLDITPTVLNLFGLPVGQDMDGKVLVDIYEKPPKVEAIPSWEEVPGECGMHPEHLREDTYDSQEALQQLIDLGYIDAPGEDMQKNIKKTVNENNFYLARAYINGNKHQEGIDLLKVLFTENPETIRYGQRLASAYLQIGKFKEVSQIVAQLTKLVTKETPGLLIMQGLAEMGENKLKKALALFQKAVKIAPDTPKIHAHLGQCFRRLGKWAEAKTAYEKALQADPENENAWHGLGIVHLRTKYYEEAAESLLTSIGLLYYQPYVHYHFAETLYELGDYERSADAFEICLRMAPGLNRARNWLVKLYEGPLKDSEKSAGYRRAMLDNTKQEILVVSGLPRSGTSMMMQMLQAGGIDLYTDGKREADENNPKGYYELEAVKGLMRNARFLKEAGDKAVKIIAPLLMSLPDRYRYKIILMQRDMDEVLRSQHRMLVRQGKAKADTIPLALLTSFKKTLEKVKHIVEQKATVQILWLDHKEVINAPLEAATKVQQFLGKEMDLEKMAGVVDRSLYREKAK